jgi:uncharacterized membrane protein YecN with MAPEG domain
VVCLRISAGIALVLTLMQLTGLLASASIARTAVTGFVSVGLLLLVAEKINAGRTWAVVLFAVIYSLGCLMFVVGLLVSPHAFIVLPAVLRVAFVVQTALQTVALVYMLSGTSRAWLKTNSGPQSHR